MGQVELFVGKGDGRLKAHPVCPDEGSCLEKVIRKCGFGHRMMRRLCRGIKTDNRGPSCQNPSDRRLLSIRRIFLGGGDNGSGRRDLVLAIFDSQDCSAEYTHLGFALVRFR